MACLTNYTPDLLKGFPRAYSTVNLSSSSGWITLIGCFAIPTYSEEKKENSNDAYWALKWARKIEWVTSAVNQRQRLNTKKSFLSFYTSSLTEGARMWCGTRIDRSCDRGDRIKWLPTEPGFISSLPHGHSFRSWLKLIFLGKWHDPRLLALSWVSSGLCFSKRPKVNHCGFPLPAINDRGIPC